METRTFKLTTLHEWANNPWQRISVTKYVLWIRIRTHYLFHLQFFATIQYGTTLIWTYGGRHIRSVKLCLDLLDICQFLPINLNCWSMYKTGAVFPGQHALGLKNIPYVAALNKMEERQRNKAHVCGYEYLRVPCGGRWQDVMKHERMRWRDGRGLRRFIPNGCEVGGVTCGWRGGTLLQRGQMPHWLEFISHRQTARSLPTLSVWVRQSVWTSQPVNLHQTRCAVTLSWWVPPSLPLPLCFISLF